MLQDRMGLYQVSEMLSSLPQENGDPIWWVTLRVGEESNMKRMAHVRHMEIEDDDATTPGTLPPTGVA
jgi:hypothetical protein